MADQTTQDRTSTGPRVLVTGATGKQGGAVAHALLARGHHIRALTRNAASRGGRALADEGAELVVGDFTNRASLDRALDGVDAVFAMATPFEAGLDAETRQGVTLADAAKAAGVFLLYSSVGSADRQTGIPHFDSKYVVEQHIQDIGVAHTILAPVFFMENATTFGREQLAQGVYALAMPGDRTLAQIAVADVGACAAAVLEDRQRYAGQRFDIAGDDLTGHEAVEVLTRVSGRPFTYVEVPKEMVRTRMGEDIVLMYEWFERVGYAIDRTALRAAFPTVGWHSFEDWAREQPWREILA
jgi:uncharacterized protein YbjT (DUF2867 family)